ncbi:Dam family site-specific DNA-(adenine-N6)-methyltransferase [Shewanella frigidimarina]|jgi:DNA adenine methylase|uniref:Site-specific DNA-methyltransferase (adenine-specific) n=1 Tax=Shewanella frigidimarina (strain NCIMB 400) TaxID=318167 RepID=Q088S4_SHEFN|nr:MULTISPECIES: Dam family site-specific DNA-(adenine-N6)-methyltransferase [Shewanella]ABI70241.1 DNA adenine methylase [Shewanella frigidimarina NCIMB 400]MBB1426059.1 Dam family site-specific DNA-(adenine-N6)-methyltransferase [Shewanella sp. SG44-2]PKI03248.1 DNA adenine methylase [Shewanella sp. 11B5]HBF48653.1 DNA adenine methylase [Shewanella frigidimarina]|tara:strand:- start:679 stop:1515 length:837 start_codon:yes stop_codon:yes gene_type:complete
MIKKHRAFLKWAGGKYKLVDELAKHLPAGNRLIEPFVGAGSVFLNTQFDDYLLCDINQDLINLYQIVQQQPDKYIKAAKAMFVDEMNDKDAYYRVRAEFNLCSDPFIRSVYFLYMNRHGFNGLCRYNRKGGFNVPFGSYKKPYFPEAEIRYFSLKAQKATFKCISYEQAFDMANSGDVIYCDPPYAPLSTTASFTTYAGPGFSLDDQALLARHSRLIAHERNIPVLISNHDIPLTRELYRGASCSTISVQRNISPKGGSRNKVDEIMALYDHHYREEE